MAHWHYTTAGQHYSAFSATEVTLTNVTSIQMAGPWYNVKYPPCLEVILEKLNLSIPSFRIIYSAVKRLLQHTTAAQSSEFTSHAE